MTDKERLEELEKIVKFQIDNDSHYGRPARVLLLGHDVTYLIEQAERVQELEDIIYQDARQDVIEVLYEENKRYREALEFINEELELVLHSDKGLAEKMFYIENSKRKITEVLEGESNE